MTTVELSVIIPVFNEEENVAVTVERVCHELDRHKLLFELVIVNDGSTDQTGEKLHALQNEYSQIRAINYFPNMGRGMALRRGFQEAVGRFIVSIDADLSYDENHIIRLYESLKVSPTTDIVLGSVYMRGGEMRDVPWNRRAISRLGNWILSFALRGKFKTITCVLRGYKKEVIQALDLTSTGKEIHLEILLKAVAYGFSIAEIPATLKWRKKGRSKFRVTSTSISHLLFSVAMRPMILFGVLGLIMIAIGVGIGLQVTYLWLQNQLNPARPIINLMIILIVGGIQTISFGFLAFQLSELRHDIIRLQKWLKSK